MKNSNYQTPPAAIQVYGVSKHYGKFTALDDVSLTVQPGEFLTLLGPSGSGKSTLLMAIAGFVDPSHGDILIGGKSIVRMPPEQRNFGVVLQGYALFPHMTVAQNIAYPLIIRKLPKNDISENVKRTLDLVQLSHLHDRLPKHLSGGQQQRVALARALVFSPQVLLLDEPMGALDKNLRHDLQVELRQLHSRLGCTFINVTHDQEEALAMSDRIAIMRAGRLEQLDDPTSLYRAPRTRFIADFLGKSNFINGTVTDVIDGAVHVKTDDGLVVHQSAGRSVAVGETIDIAIRPQFLRRNELANSRTAQVQTVLFLGTHTEVKVRCQSGLVMDMVIPDFERSAPVLEGDEINIGWMPEDSVQLHPERA